MQIDVEPVGELARELLAEAGAAQLREAPLANACDDVGAAVVGLDFSEDWRWHLALSSLFDRTATIEDRADRTYGFSVAEVDGNLAGRYGRAARRMEGLDRHLETQYGIRVRRLSELDAGVFRADRVSVRLTGERVFV